MTKETHRDPSSDPGNTDPEHLAEDLDDDERAEVDRRLARTD